VGKADERNVEVSNPVKEALPAKNARSIWPDIHRIKVGNSQKYRSYWIGYLIWTDDDIVSLYSRIGIYSSITHRVHFLNDGGGERLFEFRLRRRRSLELVVISLSPVQKASHFRMAIQKVTPSPVDE
jgi:hypothetical protein